MSLGLHDWVDWDDRKDAMERRCNGKMLHVAAGKNMRQAEISGLIGKLLSVQRFFLENRLKKSFGGSVARVSNSQYVTEQPIFPGMDFGPGFQMIY